MSKKDKIKTIEVDDVNLVPELLDGNHRVIPIVTGGDEPVEEVEVPEIIPILTLRSSVLFPGAITPITVGRDKSINLVRAVNAEGGILGAVLQRESDVEDPAPDDMYKVGTAARIIKILEMPNGNLTVILNGLEKVEITEYITTEPYFKARVTALHDSTPDVKSIEFEAFVDSIRDVALNIINVSPSMPKEAAFAIKNIDSKRGIINFICSNMELTDEDRQSLLEAPGLLARARKLLEILIREQQLAELKNQIQERVKQEIEDILAIPAEDAPEISAKQGINIDAVLEDIVQNLPCPQGDPNAPLQALIFDSYYDAYRGVIVYMRLKQGTIKPGMEVKMMATGATFKVLECGLMRPLGLEPAKQLEAGQVGYFTASIKDVHETQIGDTVTGVEHPASEPLPGYRKVRSMVYCGIYTEDGSKYPDLRDALEKLQLNDASLTFEPESSVALGFGFRCGFLGMLHMEVIQERLEREFDLDLVTTLPSVIYEVYKTDGTMVRVDNPHNYPDPAHIEHAEEPYVKVTIVTPPDYVGNIMPMCQDRRGEFKDMQYLDTYLVEMHYEMPLNEIIYDFFDTLKANTKGYASLDYELSGYRPSELVKVDILLNGDQVDALSFIAHRDKAYARARKLCEKLKDNIPRQLFEIPIQAAIGGRIIARETVKAMRKDVLAKCYGGDISRKKKLLEKQKEGKKKMRSLGTVQVPTEAFLAVLKLDE